MTPYDAQAFIGKLATELMDAQAAQQVAQDAASSAQAALSIANVRLTILKTIRDNSLQLPEIQDAARSLNIKL